MRMRTALTKSKNMVSIRILEAIGPKYAQEYVTRFGFEPDKHPPYLTMALGAGSVTAWQMARAYAVFANGGYLIQPYFILKIVDALIGLRVTAVGHVNVGFGDRIDFVSLHAGHRLAKRALRNARR